MKIPVIYIAAPFSASTGWGIAENVRAAERIGLEVARCGCMPLIPHANTAHFHGEGPHLLQSERDLAQPNSQQTYGDLKASAAAKNAEFWYAGTMELLRRCDAAVFAPNWETSSGCKHEMEEARSRAIPVHIIESSQPPLAVFLENM